MTHLNGGGDAFPAWGSVRPDHAAALAEARRLVEGTTLSQHAIAQQLRVSASTISLWKKKWGWARPEGVPTFPEVRNTEKAADKRREVLVDRLYRVFDRQLMDVESRAADAVATTEEKDARTLGTLARTLGTLIALETAGGRDDGAQPDAPEPYDPDEIRARLAQRLRGWTEGGNLRERIAALSLLEKGALAHDWDFQARDDQFPPQGEWLVWLMMGGRGAGKTRAGAEWVRGMALGHPRFTATPVGRIALVGETFADVRDVMIEGVSGILSVHGRHERPAWTASRRQIEWANGARAQAFSSEDPESLRGPQFGASWGDELGKWKHAEATWDMLQFGLRLGDHPRQVVTTTPRPVPLLRRLLKADGTVVSRARTADNSAYLAIGFMERIAAQYGGTRLGRQELDGELIEDRSDALWQRAGIEAARIGDAPDLARIVVAVDPPASRRSGICGIVAAGLGKDGIGYVLADATLREVRPAEWAARAVALYRRLDADALVAEVNQGGDMVAAVIREVDAGVPVKEVRATRGKWLRAEPVAALYAQGRVRHVGAMPELEDELCDFGPDGLSAGRSPDRLDALVWAITALMLGAEGEPKVRGM